MCIHKYNIHLCYSGLILEILFKCGIIYCFDIVSIFERSPRSFVHFLPLTLCQRWNNSFSYNISMIGAYNIVFEYCINYAVYIDKTWSSLSACHEDLQGSGDIASLILHRSTRWRWMISLCLSHYFPQEKASSSHWIRLSGQLSQCGCFLENRKFLLGIQPWFLCQSSS